MSNLLFPAAEPAIYLASSPEAKGVSGKYYGSPHEEEKPNPVVRDAEVQERLWRPSEANIKQRLNLKTFGFDAIQDI